jgi:salicylate hydroxylase
MTPSAPVAVIGAGIAGLVAALALAQRGIAVDVIERTTRLDAVGAGIQLSPNATRILQALGLAGALARFWVEPDEIRLADGASLRRIATVPAGDFARARWGAPYAVIARADLQRILADAVRAHPLSTLHLGVSIEDATPDAVARQTGRTPGLLVGADGMRSRVRGAITGHAEARFSGNVAWRFRLPPGSAGPFNADVVTACLGRRAHLVVYPMGRLGLPVNAAAEGESGRPSGGLNIVVIASGVADTPANRPSLPFAGRLSGWNRDIVASLEKAEPLGLWPLYEVGDGALHDADRILIGDAAHAMMPFAAQGAAMAIEDGYELAAALAATRSPDAKAGRATAIETFVKIRKARIERVRARGAFNRFAYHASGPLRLGRDLVLSLRSQQSLAEDFDWLYGYTSPA